jgi:hypothetical protein
MGMGREGKEKALVVIPSSEETSIAAHCDISQPRGMVALHDVPTCKFNLFTMGYTREMDELPEVDPHMKPSLPLCYILGMSGLYDLTCMPS